MPKRRNRAFDDLGKRIGHTFSQPALLERALTHRSSSGTHMERLEFLGDAVLGLAVAEYLHTNFPDMDEGTLSRMRALLIRRESLAVIAGQWQLAPVLRVGDSERDSEGGIRSPSIPANAVEAVIGAVFVDGGWDAARAVVLAAWEDLFRHADTVETRDAKTRLQEYTQAKGRGLPEYVVVDAGAGASPRFMAECWVNGQLLGRGSGDRKKEAETRAAAKACEHVQQA
ncbi:MAG: ribonuclease III [Mariprofundaceae bacterium]|nr:ribonuclease III [Mariprofundaceae bacterium]